METTLILFKPDAVQKALVGKVLDRFESAGLTIRGIKMFKADDAILNEHYAHVADKPFYPELETFMQQTPMIALALSGESAIDRARELLGPTDSQKAAKGTIRGDFGEDVMVNVCHASDTPEAAGVELERFFQNGELF